MWAKLAFRLFKRELFRGELTIISAAIALAVLTVLTLSSVTQRINDAIASKSASFIAADRVIASNHVLPNEFLVEAKANGLNTGQITYFDTMVYAGDAVQLTSVKAVSPSYPLRGEVKIARTLGGPIETGAQLQENEVWLNESIFYALDVKVGDSVEIGDARFNIGAVLVEEPDAPFNVFSSSRRAIMRLSDVAQTQVVQPGSRVFYRVLLAGSEPELETYYAWLKPNLKPNQNWYGVKDRQSPISDSLNRAERFLLLAGLLGIILAAVAIAVSAKRYCERQYDPVAMMKTLGGSRKQIRAMYVLHLLLICVFSMAIGGAIGYFLQDYAAGFLAKNLGQTLPPVGLRPWLLALGTGLICAVMFSIKPLLDLFDIPPLRVLRRSIGDRLTVSKIHLSLSTLTVFGLMYGFSLNLKITAMLFLSSLLLVLILFGISKLLFKGGRKLGLSPGNAWSLAIASIQKRANANAVQLVSFALAIKLLLFLIVLKNDIIADWQAQLPKNAPNAFMVNINDYQLEDVKARLEENGIQASNFYPLVRGRVNAINGEQVARRVSAQENEKKDEEARSGAGRELNLTWQTDMPEHNTLVAGTFFTDDAKAEASIEAEFAKRMGIELGDKIGFLIGSQSFEVTVTSLREVNWSTLKPNFFFILSPNVLANFPATYISSVHIDKDSRKAYAQILRDNPTISSIDVENIVNQVQSTIEQVSLAIGFVLLIVVVCGSLVLISQVQASLGERMQEIVILRTLGAKGRLIKNAVLFEFLLLGLLAGGVAAIISDGVLFTIQRQVFEMPGLLHPSIWLIGPASGALFVAVLGYASIAKTLKRNTQTLVRELA